MKIVSTFLALASRVSAEGLIFKVLIVILSCEKIIPTSRRSRLRVGLGVVKLGLLRGRVPQGGSDPPLLRDGAAGVCSLKYLGCELGVAGGAIWGKAPGDWRTPRRVARCGNCSEILAESSKNLNGAEHELGIIRHN